MNPSHEVVVSRELSPKAGCQVAGLVYLLSGKWVLAALYALHESPQPLRFSELSAVLGEVSTSELSRALKRLEAMNLIARRSYNQVPPRVEYSCTSLGRSLKPVLDRLAEWVEANRPALGVERPSAGPSPSAVRRA